MKCFKQRLLEMPMLHLDGEIRRQKRVVEVAQYDLRTMQEAYNERIICVGGLLKETERLYDEGDKGEEWANTLGFLGTWPESKHYRKPPAGRSDLEITLGIALNEYDRALNIERRRYA